MCDQEKPKRFGIRKLHCTANAKPSVRGCVYLEENVILKKYKEDEVPRFRENI